MPVGNGFLIINYLSFGILGDWTEGNTRSTLSTAYLFGIGSDLYCGGRVGIISSSTSSLDLGYGAIALRRQPKDRDGFYEVNLSLTGAAYGTASLGIRF